MRPDLNQSLGDFLEDHVDALYHGDEIVLTLPLGGDTEGEILTILVTAIEETSDGK